MLNYCSAQESDSFEKQKETAFNVTLGNAMEASCTLIWLTTISVVIIALNVAKLRQEVKGLRPLSTLVALTTVFFLFVTVPWFLSLPVFWTYQKLVYVYLKLKHGSQFVGFIKGNDVCYASNRKRDSVIMALFMFEVSEETTPDEVFDSVRGIINKHFIGNKNKLNKFHCIVRAIGGYLCMMKEEIAENDCLRKMEIIGDKEEITKEELMKIINGYQHVGFLKDDALLWDVFVGGQPVRWTYKNGTKHFPVLIRMHHGVCDGFTFGEFVLGVVADECPGRSPEPYIEKTRAANWGIAQRVAISAYSIIYGPTAMIAELLKEKTKLKELTQTGLYCARVENGEYYHKIKLIKRRLGNVSFSDLIFAALSYSLHEHFRLNIPFPPKRINLAVPFLRKATYLPQLPIGRLDIDNVELQNTFDLLNLELPVFVDDDSGYQRLRAVQEQTRKMLTSTTNKVFYFATHILMQILPVAMVRFIIRAMQWEAVVSILPGPGRATMDNGKLSLESVVFWVPRMKGIGLNFSMASYANKFHLGLNIDSALVDSEKDAQKILDGIFKYFDLLEKEIDFDDFFERNEF